MRTELPEGSVTFVLTDIDGSTRLLQRIGEAAYAVCLAEHRQALRDACTRCGGVEVDTQGDACFFAFATPDAALEASLDALHRLDEGQVRVRIGIHTGTPVRTAEGYVGEDVHRAARIAAAGSGGQVLISGSTARLIDIDRFRLTDLGDHRFKDLSEAERVFQLGDGVFPRIRSLYRSDLPVSGTPFVGRERDVTAVAALLRDERLRLVTLTGPGGTGKTRLALRSAEVASSSFPDGLWWVPLADLADRGQVLARVAQALEIPEDGGESVLGSLAGRLGGKQALVLIDNAEHLLPEVATDLAELLSRVAGMTLLVTSRERLQIAAEHGYAVTAMDPGDAAEFLVDRAAASGIAIDRSELVDALCARLDRLPLAIQLAAPRLKLYSLEQLVERLTSRLDALRGGRDVDPRQATLRATIAWSHDLLDDEDRAALARLSVFVGGFTVAAAAAVANADPETLLSLLDKSLLQRTPDGPPRLSMLGTINEFAAERLAERGEAEPIREAHSRWSLDLAERADAELRRGEPEELAIAPIDAEIDNLRASLEHGVLTSDADLVRRITVALPMYWIMRDRYTEARAWLQRALAMSPVEDQTRIRLLSSLAGAAYRLGDHAAAIEASDAAAALTLRLGGVADRYREATRRAVQAWESGDLDQAEQLYAQAFEVALEVDNGVGMSACRLNRAAIANSRGRHGHARELLDENLPFVRGRGQSRCEAYTLAGLAETAVLEDRPNEVPRWAVPGARRASGFGETSLAAYCLDIAATGLAQGGDPDRAATILGATERALERLEVVPDDDDAAMRRRAIAALEERLGAEELQRAWSRGRALDLPEAIEIATMVPDDGPTARS